LGYIFTVVLAARIGSARQGTSLPCGTDGPSFLVERAVRVAAKAMERQRRENAKIDGMAQKGKGTANWQP